MSDPIASTADAELRAHLARILDGTYGVDTELGRGGMGIVYKARDLKLKRTVAIKVLPPELAFRGEIRARFLREAETAAQLSHPNIVPIYSVDEKEGLVFFVMAFVDGENLAQWIHNRGAMDPVQGRRVLRDVADALAYAHARKVIHRDIKPDNILLDAGSGRPMVTDFGIARAISEGADSRLTATGMAIGTPAYMSPEQSAGDKQVDGRTDLYSLGVVAYQLLSGEPPFIASSTPAMLVKHLSERPMPLQVKRASVPADLAAVVMCLLEKNPADRFPDAVALVAALDGQGSVPRPSAPTPLAPLAPHAWSPMPSDVTVPTTEQLSRWNAPVVNEFRKKLAPFLVVNGVIIVVSTVTRTNLTFVTAFWSVYLAFKYAKLWSEGFDWRDVFRQPRDRLLFDVVSEWMDDIRAFFDRDKRAEVRARWRAQSLQPGLMTPPPMGSSMPAGMLGASTGSLSRSQARDIRRSQAGLGAIGGPAGDRLRRAIDDRTEIAKLVAALPASERKQLKDVDETAKALTDRIKGLSIALAELERSAPTGGTDAIDREIAMLESQANPLDRDASEARVRRLAMLKRDRRGISDRGRRREEIEGKLESCALALQNLRFDVLRLATGASSTSNVTLIAERAMSLARDVDGMISANASVSGAAGNARGTPAE
ncbi:MAG TPA: protein kinase [Gemmatimonadaceae bacterium]|nr:protein kinase [Gemmatimonadaceae bacterium]